MDGVLVQGPSAGYRRSDAQAMFELADIACMELEEFLWDWHRHIITGHKVPAGMIMDGVETRCSLSQRLNGLLSCLTEQERFTLTVQHRSLHRAAALIARQVGEGRRWTGINYDALVQSAGILRAALGTLRDRLMLEAAVEARSGAPVWPRADEHEEKLKASGCPDAFKFSTER